jgi:subtilase family protein
MSVYEDAEAHDREHERRVKALGRAAGVDPERLTILSESRATLTNLETEVTTYKVLDREDGESRRVALDARGRPQEVDDLLKREQAAAHDRYGSLHEALHELVEARGGEVEPVPVLLRYAVDEDPVDLDKRELDDRELTDRRLARLGEQARRQVEKVERQARALHREVLAAYKIEQRVAGRPRSSGPFVRARIPVRALRELSRDERIAFIGPDEEKQILDYPTIPQSLPTTRADTVQGSGFRGAGVKVAVLESGGLWKPAACFNIGATQVSGLAADSHMTKSVGIIGNRYSSGGCSGAWQGYAPDATVLLANDSNYQTAYDWARGQGVNVVTMSWHYPSEETNGGLHSRDVYFDYWVTRYPYPSVFTSAGNEAGSTAYASGKGYNFFGVGNVLNDGDGNRCNDAISSSSSLENPTSPHSDHEVPAVAAPGSRHDLLGSDFGGTSCATPVTAAIGALLMSRNTSLKIWPEAIRAILLATANYQNADGANYSKYADGADGAGLVNAYYGMLTAGRRESGVTAQFRAHDYGLMTAADFVRGMFNKEWKARTFTTSSRIRVALTWNSEVTASGGAPSSSVLDADLDLWVYDPDGILVAWGTTWDNSWEFVELTPAKTGTYTIKIRGYSVPPGFSSWYGVAWTTHYDLC